MASPVSRLLRYLRETFNARQTAIEARGKPSKRHPIGDDKTGPAAAGEYAWRHPRGLRQAMRENRIARGVRPLRFDVPGKRERAVMRKLKSKDII